MSERFSPNALTRIGNRFMGAMLRVGLGPKQLYVVTVRGRKSGRPRSTPVMLMGEDSERFIVSAPGEVDWVKNARAAGQVTLSRGGEEETVAVSELTADKAAPILQEYVAAVPGFVGRYFDATPDSPFEAFVAEAANHPVFRIEQATQGEEVIAKGGRL